MGVAYLDTHVALYLHDGLTEELSSRAIREIEANDLLVSPMVFLEFDYMFRRKRIANDARSILAILTAAFGVSLCPLRFENVVLEAVGIDWTNDPFDRIIVAQAIAGKNAKLITRDRLIRQHYLNAVW